MKIICNCENISEATLKVANVVSTKNTLPALEGILMEANGECVKFTGFDPSIGLGMTTTINSTVFNEGKILVNARIFNDIIKKMPGENVSIESDEKNVITINSGNSEFSIIGMNAMEYPDLPKIEESNSSFIINSENLKTMVNSTKFAVAVVDTKPALTGVLFNINAGEISVVAIDGYRLAIRKERIDFMGDLKFIVPAKTLTEVLKIVSDAESDVKIFVGNRNIEFRMKDFVVISRLLEGEFLDYNNAIPVSSSSEVFVNTRDMISAIERISLLISDRLKSPVRCNVGEDMISVRCSTTIGKAYDEFTCQNAGETVEIGFNNRYMLDALHACDTDKIKVKFNGALSPITITPVEGDNFLFLVLPVRLKNE